MIMTIELADKRKQAREVYPDCDWLPGDECPIGTVVTRFQGDKAEILGESKDENLKYWWILKDFKMNAIVYDWPPSLKKL